VRKSRVLFADCTFVVHGAKAAICKFGRLSDQLILKSNQTGMLYRPARHYSAISRSRMCALMPSGWLVMISCW